MTGFDEAWLREYKAKRAAAAKPSYGAWSPPEPDEKPTIVGYDDTLHPVWFDEDNEPHPGRCAILSNGVRIAVRDDR